MSHASSLLFLYQMSTTSLSTLPTCTLIRLTARLPPRSLFTSSSHGYYPCADSSNASFSLMPESTSPTGYEPNCLIEDNSKDLNEMTSMEIKPMFFHRPSLTSTYGSAESVATPTPESDLDDDQIRNLLASPLYLQEREACFDRSRVYHSFKRKLSVQFISLP